MNDIYGVIDFTRINTEPGARSAFAPPADWTGDYLRFMRRRWAKDPGARQHVAIVGGMLAKKEPTEFLGPYAKEARAIALSVNPAATKAKTKARRSA